MACLPFQADRLELECVRPHRPPKTRRRFKEYQIFAAAEKGCLASILNKYTREDVKNARSWNKEYNALDFAQRTWLLFHTKTEELEKYLIEELGMEPSDGWSSIGD